MARSISGTVNFMSPQQRQNFISGSVRYNAFKADIYALGMTAFAMASLAPEGRTWAETPVENFPSDIKSLNYSQMLKDLLMAMLAGTEESRPTMQEVLEVAVHQGRLYSLPAPIDSRPPTRDYCRVITEAKEQASLQITETQLKLDFAPKQDLIGPEIEVVFMCDGRIIYDTDWNSTLKTPSSVKLGLRLRSDTITLEVAYQKARYFIELSSNDSICAVKSSLTMIAGVSFWDQILQRQNRVLDSAGILGELGLMSGHVLTLICKSNASFLYLTLASNWTYPIEFDSNLSVATLKGQVSGIFGYAAEDQILETWNGLEMSDDETMSQYDVFFDDRILLKFKLWEVKVALPGGKSLAFLLTHELSISALESLIASELTHSSARFLLTTPDNWVIVRNDRPLSAIPKSLKLLTPLPDQYILVEGKRTGLAHLIENPLSIADIRAKLAKDFAYPLDSQILVQKGDIVNQDSFRIRNEDCFQLFTDTDKITLYVQKSSTAWISVEIAYGSTVWNIKQIISKLEGLAPNSQTLIHSRRELSDGHTLVQCGLVPGSVLLIFSALPTVLTSPVVMESFCVQTAQTVADLIKSSIATFQKSQPSQHNTPPSPPKQKNRQELRTKGMYLAAALSRQFAPVSFAPNDPTISGVNLSLQECEFLIHLIMKRRLGMAQANQKIQVAIRVLAVSTFSLAVLPSHGVGLIKAMVNAVYAIPVEEQILILAGDVLPDSATVQSSGIQDGDCLALFWTRPGLIYLLSDIFDSQWFDIKLNGIYRYRIALHKDLPVKGPPSYIAIYTGTNYPTFNSSGQHHFSKKSRAQINSDPDLEHALRSFQKINHFEGCSFRCVLEVNATEDTQTATTFEGCTVMTSSADSVVPVALLVQEYFADINITIECSSTFSLITVSLGEKVLTIIKAFERVKRTPILGCHLWLKSVPEDVFLCDTGDFMHSGMQKIVDTGIENGSVLVLIQYKADVSAGSLGPVTPRIKGKGSKLSLLR